MLRWIDRWLGFFALRLGPGNQAIKIIAVGPVGLEGFLVKQAFDAASHAYLVGVALGANGPAHFAVPATAKHDYGGPGQSRRSQA